MLSPLRQSAPTRRLLASAISLAALAAVTAPPPALAAPEVSGNWSGYAARPLAGANGSFSSVSGLWRLPTASCAAGRESSVGVWVGLGGYSARSPALEQIGSSIECTHAGRAVYSSWFELVPSPPIAVHVAAHAGDEIAASATVRGRDVTLRMRDLTTGARFAVTRHPAAIDASSAEWIVEAPSVCLGAGGCRVLPLADFGSAAFLSASATAVGHTGAPTDTRWSATALELRELQRAAAGQNPSDATVANLVTATPSAPSLAGGSFSVTWSSRSVSAASVPSEGGPVFEGRPAQESLSR